MKRIWIHFLVGLSEIGLLCDILGRVFSRPWHKSYSKSVKLKVGHVYGALETCAWLGIHINSELFLFLLFEYSAQKKNCLAKKWEKGGGGYSPLSPACVVGPGAADPVWNDKTIMLETWNVVVSTHICSFRKYTFYYQRPFLMSAFFLQKISIFW